jgi:hypothetical protein
MKNIVEQAVTYFKATNRKPSSYECKELTALIRAMSEKEFLEYAQITEEWSKNQ